MLKTAYKLIIASVFLTSFAINSNAGVINYSLPDVNNYSSTGNLVSWYSTPAINGNVESFTLSFDWKDQGWGNRKGNIFYSTANTAWTRLTGTVAGHHWTSEVISVFSQAANDLAAPINFAYIVGGGGGHRLYIDNAKLAVNVSEPMPIALLSLGLAGLMISRRKAKK